MAFFTALFDFFCSFRNLFRRTPPVVPKQINPKNLRGTTENDLGPLAVLVGTWVGTNGLNIVQVPNRASGVERFTNMVNPYSETIEFTSIGGLVANRGGDKQQFVSGLKYDLKVTANNVPGNPEIHVENGMYLNLTHIEQQPDGPVSQFAAPATSGPFPVMDFPIVRQGSIPHGNMFAAPASVVVSQGAPVFTADGLLGLFLTSPSNGPALGYGEDLRDYKSDLMKTLQDELDAITGKGGRFGQLTTFTFDTDVQPGGGIVSVAFESGQTSSKFVPTRFQGRLWIVEYFEASSTAPKLLVQYLQRTDLLFNKGSNSSKDQGLINWPHIQVQTLKKL